MAAIDRRTLLRGALAATAAGALGGAAKFEASGLVRRRPYLPYTSDSYFRSKAIGRPISRARTAEFREFMRSHPDQRDKPFPYINGATPDNNWGMPFAQGRSHHPVWRLVGTMPDEVARTLRHGIHAPEWFGRLLTGTSDSPFVCLDRVNRVTVWGYQGQVVAPYTISVANAGVFVHNSNGLDRRNPRSNSSMNFRGRGCIPDAMVIRADLMRAAIANGTGLGHVLHMWFVETSTAAGFRHPMVGEESGKHGWGAEGTRLAIHPDVDLSRRRLSPAGLAVARTLQIHGCYLGDNSGSSSAFKAQQATRFRNPWNRIGLNQKSLAGLTWNDFVVLA